VAVEGRGPGAHGLAAQVAATFPLAGARVIFPAASGAAPTVEEEFTALGARVTRVDAYRTVVTPPPADRMRGDLAAGVDAVTFASPSAVEAVDRALGGEMAGGLAGLAVVCIGPTTAAALERRGISDVRVAATATLEAMAEAVVARTGARPLGAPP
ncbi:MAG: uroporphyrinogen-III synthase, partial [Gammaproteobacteria bacterium]|nr:uroporphyrinogen-III synthase [Gammaproteobacteria bacterium]